MGLNYDFKILKYHHTRIEDGLTVVKGSFEFLYYNIKHFKLGKEKSADVSLLWCLLSTIE